MRVDRILLGIEIEEFLKEEILFDANGHSLFRPDIFFRALRSLKKSSLLALSRAIKTKIPSTAMIKFKGLYGCRCDMCGLMPTFVTDGIRLKVLEPCDYPGVLPLSCELNIPSGIMMVANDLRPAFDVFGNFGINSKIGCLKTTRAMADIGCAFAFVGNSCPSMYRFPGNRFTIANYGSGYLLDGILKHQRGRRVAGICTDLWWYSIVDGDEFKRRGCESKHQADSVRIKPGVYRFSHHMYERDFDHDARHIIYSSIEWIRPPDPVKDYLAEFRRRNFTAGQVISSLMTQRPDLYSSVRSIADHIFCVVGGGGNWHPNGFVQYNPDMSIDCPEVAIPKFTGVDHWYPLSEYSSLCCAAGIGKESIFLNPSFAALAKNVASCIADHGMKKGSNLTDEQYKTENQNTKELAMRCLKALEEKYPSV